MTTDYKGSGFSAEVELAEKNCPIQKRCRADST